MEQIAHSLVQRAKAFGMALGKLSARDSGPGPDASAHWLDVAKAWLYRRLAPR